MKEPYADLNREELIALVEKQVEEIARLQEAVAELKERLRNEERSSKRQAAPFAKGKRKANPKKPGRKSGRGTFKSRDVPREEEITDVVDVALESEICPKCGSDNLGPTRIEHAYLTDLPDTPKPKVIDYRFEERKCLDCGAIVRGQHPDVEASQRGASAHRFGDGVWARAHVLHYGFGVAMRKVPGILRELCGVTITQGAVQRDALRRSQQEIGSHYEHLRARVKDDARVFTDDTGWRINGEPAQLMGFETDEVVVYQIRLQHRNEEVREVIPEDYAHGSRTQLRCQGARRGQAAEVFLPYPALDR